jgi:hypothetical protein
MHRGTVLRIGVVGVWLVLVLWLIRYEAFPEYFTHNLRGYQTLISRDTLVQDSWSRLLFRKTPIGYANTTMEIQEKDPSRYYAIRSQMFLKLNAMGRNQEISTELTVYLSAVQMLQSFDLEVKAEPYSTRFHAIRVRGDEFRVTITSSGAKRSVKMTIPDDVVLYSPITEMALKSLSPGSSVNLKVLDPATLGTAVMTVTALRREPLVQRGQTNDTLLLESDYQGMKFQTWMDRNGQLLRQDTPFGWALERCTAEEAFSTFRNAGDSSDMLEAMAIPCIGNIRDQRKASELRLRLSGVALDKSDFPSVREKLVYSSGTTAEVTVARATFPEGPETGPAPGPEYLAATPMIQSDHPDMRRQALAITEGIKTPSEKAKAISSWVHREVKKEMNASLPSSLDVLKTKRGDCNEHTYLFVGLARAAGLPSAVKVGVAYQRGSFYYHAWPAVWVGDWVEMEPTWGEETVDATHIAFVEGELNAQMRLLKVMGKLRIEILDER